MSNKNILIICESIYRGNTYKLARAMANKLNCDVVDIKSSQNIDLSNYTFIGLGSGIYFTGHHPELIKIVERLDRSHRVFIFSTHGAPYLGKYHDQIKDVLNKKNIKLIGEYSTKGYDCTGPFIILGGVNKNRPNLKDEIKAQRFVEGILPNQIKRQREVPKNHYVQVDQDCIGCKKCVGVCPLNVFEMQNDKSVPVNEVDCTHCSLCVEQCPTQAINIRHNFKEAIGIAVHHAKRKSL